MKFFENQFHGSGIETVGVSLGESHYTMFCVAVGTPSVMHGKTLNSLRTRVPARRVDAISGVSQVERRSESHLHAQTLPQRKSEHYLGCATRNRVQVVGFQGFRVAGFSGFFLGFLGCEGFLVVLGISSGFVFWGGRECKTIFSIMCWNGKAQKKKKNTRAPAPSSRSALTVCPPLLPPFPPEVMLENTCVSLSLFVTSQHDLGMLIAPPTLCQTHGQSHVFFAL